MGPSLLLLPLLLLLIQTCVPASWGLRCLRCERSGSCQVEECAHGQDLCRTTVLHVWEEEDLEVVERGCTHPEKTNRTMSYRTSSKIISLTETVCASNMCNQPRPGGRTPAFPQGRYLECASCTSSDLSCERGREQNLQCRNPRDQCLEVVTQQGLEEIVMEENHIRGCGSLPGCPGPTGFHSNLTFHFLRCCNSSKCNSGPVLELQHLPPNGIQCYSCEGNSTHGCSSEDTSLIDCRGPMNQCLEAKGTHEMENRSHTFRGCATASWCQGSHVADAFRLTRFNVSCCAGSGCNHPLRDVHYRRGAAARPHPAHLGLTVSLLLATRLWADALLWP